MDNHMYGDHLDDKFFESQKAISGREKIWQELDINKPRKKPYKTYWLFLLGSGIALLLTGYLYSKYSSSQTENEKLEIRYAGLLEQYNTLSESYDKLNNQIATTKINKETVTDMQPQPSIEREVVIEYVDKIINRTDTVFIGVEPKIVYEDRVIRDTVYLDRIVEIQAEVITASTKEPENKVKRRGEELIFHLENRTKDSGGQE